MNKQPTGEDIDEEMGPVCDEVKTMTTTTPGASVTTNTQTTDSTSSPSPSQSADQNSDSDDDDDSSSLQAIPSFAVIASLLAVAGTLAL